MPFCRVKVNDKIIKFFLRQHIFSLSLIYAEFDRTGVRGNLLSNLLRPDQLSESLLGGEGEGLGVCQF